MTLTNLHRPLAAVVFASLACLPTVSQAKQRIEARQPVSSRFETNLAERHDRGAYLRMSLGAGYASWWSSDLGVQGGRIGDGVGASGQIAVGWLPWEKVALHVSAWAITGYTLTLAGAGPGITYWFSDDSPWYLSIALGPTTTGSTSAATTTAQWGFGGEAEIGLMGWIADHSMLGMSLVTGAEGFDLDGDNTHIEGWRMGLRLSMAFE